MDEARFVEHLAACLRDGSGEPAADLGALHIADVFLAWACGMGDQDAATTLVASHLSHLEPEQQQGVYERLLSGEQDDRKILRYAGRAPLSRWISVVARNQASTRLRHEGRAVPADKQILERLLAAGAEPELETLKHRFRGLIEEALRTAVTRLRPRDRRVLQLTMVKQLSLAKVGLVFDVDKTTVWHWIQKIREQLREDIEQHLAAAGIAPSDLASIVRALRSQVDIGLSGLSRDHQS